MTTALKVAARWQRQAAAKTPADMLKDGYWLDIDDRGGAVEFILREKTRKEVGHVRIRHLSSCKAWEVMNSYAREGYGPMLYDVAMEFAGKEGVVPDRGEVSPAARQLWSYYMKSRRSDVDWEPLDADPKAIQCHLHSDYDEADREPLDYRFTAKSQKTIAQLKKLKLWPL